VCNREEQCCFEYIYMHCKHHILWNSTKEVVGDRLGDAGGDIEEVMSNLEQDAFDFYAFQVRENDNM
jgi:hypothetical protein